MVRTFWLFRGILRPYGLIFLIGCLLLLVVASADVAGPWPLKVIVDNVLRGDPHGLSLHLLRPNRVVIARETILALALVALLAIVAVGAVANYLGTFLLNAAGERMMADLRGGLFAHMQRLSLTYYDQQRVGDLTTRVTGDVENVQDLLVATFSVLVPNLAVLAGIVGVMFAVDSGFAALSVAVAPLLFFTVFKYTRRIKQASRAARRKEGEVASVVSETVAAIRVVQAYTGEQQDYGRFAERNTERALAGLKVVELQATLSPLVDVIVAAGTVVVLWFGAHRVLDGRLSVGLLLVFLAYVAQLYRPMRNLAKFAPVLSRGQASAERVQSLLAVDVGLVERPGAVAAPRLSGRVAVRSVTFGYEPGRPVLQDASIDAAPGEVIALAGPSGAGKSSLISLIPRLYDPWSGQVLLDGRDVRDLRLASLRQQVALVLQDAILFHGSVYENIAYGALRPPTAKQVYAAARAAHVDEFAHGLPDGYDTVVSERGTTLSGGQRQRLAIARAIVREAPIVILDEPTSSLDPISEQYVLDALEHLMRGRTVIVVAHRLSTLRRADRIYVLSDGKIIDSGSHQALLNRPGIYREMHAEPAAGA